MKVLIACLASIAISGCASRPQEPPQSTQCTVAKPQEPKGLRLTWPKVVFTIEFSNLFAADPDSNPPKPGQAWVKIIKVDPAFGEIEWTKIHSEGRHIGWSEEEGVPTSIHRVFSAKNRRMVSVDFDTKARLVKIEVDKLVAYVSRHCPALKDNLARCPGPTGVNSAYKVNQVVIASESGPAEVVQELSGPGPTPDTLCRAHGGKGEAPKLTEEELGRAHTAEAETLLWSAESGWQSKNPRVRQRSRDSYRRLLKEFPAESVVTKNQERIKARAEADIED